MVQLRDASDLIVIDTLMNQQDRFGNVHYQETYFYRDTADPNPDGSPKLKSSRELTPQQVAQLGAVRVKTLLLKDNDCGVSKTNVARQAGLIDRVAHIDPDTYRRVLEFRCNRGLAHHSRFFRPGTSLYLGRLHKCAQQSEGGRQQTSSRVCSGPGQTRLGSAGAFLGAAVEGSGL